MNLTFTNEETEDREVKKLAQGHKASKLKRQELNLGSQVPGPMLRLMLAAVLFDISFPSSQTSMCAAIYWGGHCPQTAYSHQSLSQVQDGLLPPSSFYQLMAL